MVRCWPPNPCNEGSNPSTRAKYIKKGVFFMKKSNYIKIMFYLDVIEKELNKLAKANGHCNYSEFINRIQ